MTLWPEYRTNWDPFEEMRALQREVNRVFDGGRYRGPAEYPLVNVWTSENEAVVTAELPGVDPKDVDIRVLRGQLTIEGDRKADAPAEDVVCHRAERSHGRFVRTLRLPFEVEDSKVSAKYDKGVLTITLPRSEATKPKRIAIEAS
jgi:HSP20 family protein